MSYSITGIAYLILSFSLGYLIYRFFYYWKKERDSASRQALYIVSFFGLFVLNATIAGLFFADDLSFLITTVKINIFIQSLAFAAIAYNVIYLKFRKISPWLGFIPVFILGMIATILTVAYVQFDPFLEASGSINWGVPSGPMAIFVMLLRAFISLVTMVPLIIIFLLQFKNSKDPFIRKKSLGLGLAFLLVLIGALLDFLFIRIFNLDPIWRDLTFSICSIIILITLILTLPRSDIGRLKYEPR